MKNFKKFLALIMALAMTAVVSVSAMAAQKPAAGTELTQDMPAVVTSQNGKTLKYVVDFDKSSFTTENGLGLKADTVNVEALPYLPQGKTNPQNLTLAVPTLPVALTQNTFVRFGRIQTVDGYKVTTKNGYVTAIANKKGKTNFKYSKGHLQQITSGNTNVVFSYDKNGKMTSGSMTNGQQKKTFKFDTNGRLTSASTSGKTTKYNYTKTGYISSFATTVKGKKGYTETVKYGYRNNEVRTINVSSTKKGFKPFTLTVTYYTYTAHEL